MPIFTILIVILNFSFLAFNLRSAGAQSMSNDNYMLQLQDLDTSSGKKEADGGVMDTKAQEDSNQKQEPMIKANKNTLAFSISETLIYFGHLSPTNPILRSNKLSLTKGSSNGYSVIAFEDQELSSPEIASQSGTIIPDTSCDDGLCSELSSAPWINTLTYGFGFRCDDIIGTGCLTDFLEQASYKQFANISKKEMPQVILSGTSSKKENTYLITYKLNISGAQPKGPYQNVITYIAVPNF